MRNTPPALSRNVEVDTLTEPPRRHSTPPFAPSIVTSRSVVTPPSMNATPQYVLTRASTKSQRSSTTLFALATERKLDASAVVRATWASATRTWRATPQTRQPPACASIAWKRSMVAAQPLAKTTRPRSDATSAADVASARRNVESGPTNAMPPTRAKLPTDVRRSTVTSEPSVKYIVPSPALLPRRPRPRRRTVASGVSE
mmetsp:Transcript_16500/g.57590  ORF Transcript_16500/g.57590 Transcript_16500/m.57590 type:complete len:201 (-) Transcript_16500:755-1357(-)